MKVKAVMTLTETIEVDVDDSFVSLANSWNDDLRVELAEMVIEDYEPNSGEIMSIECNNIELLESIGDFPEGTCLAQW